VECDICWSEIKYLITTVTDPNPIYEESRVYRIWGMFAAIKYKFSRFVFPFPSENTLTHSLMELSPSWGAANCAATQEASGVLWNPKVHYRFHKSPSLVPILSQIDPIHAIPSYLSKIHFNIVHPPTSWSSQWTLSFWIFWKHTQIRICKTIILPVCLFEHGALSLTLREHRWRFLRTKYREEDFEYDGGSKRGWGTLHNEELQKLNFS
jgi:hypothetical protein